MKTTFLSSIITLVVFSACNNSTEQPSVITKEKPTELSQKEKEIAIKKGKEIAENTFKVLSGNLKKAMSDGGTENAINYCNANVSNLMDSLGKHYNASIRRTSNKVRNENNSPTEAEKNIINGYMNSDEMKPIVNRLDNGNTAFYTPIKMKPLCISCHGTVGKSISQENYAIIKKHYLNDKAINYEVGDFRGIWSIEIKN